MSYKRLRYAIVCAPGPFAVTLAMKPFGELGMIFFGGVSIILSLGLLVWKPSKSLLLLGVLSLTFALSILFSGWPFYLAFHLSEPAFDRAAMQLREGETLGRGRWIGLFRVDKMELDRDGVPCLWLDLSPNGYTGFVACGPVDPPFNLWEHRVMNERWQFIIED